MNGMRLGVLVAISLVLGAVASHVGAQCELIRLEAPDGQNGWSFGESVAFSGDVLVVGAEHATVSSVNEGAVYIFYRDVDDPQQWVFHKKISAPTPQPGNRFGHSVDIDDDTIVVGAIEAFDTANDSGLAHVFGRNTGGPDNWGHVTLLHSPAPQANGFFGKSVAIAGDTLVVGAHGENSSQGAAYRYDRNQGGANNWGHVQTLARSDPLFGDQFGHACDIIGNGGGLGDPDIIVVGGPQGVASPGRVWVYERPIASFNEVERLEPPGGVANDRFGWAVALDETSDPARVIIGAPTQDTNGNGAGAIYIYERAVLGFQWNFVVQQFPGDAAAGDFFGAAVTIEGPQALSSALFHNHTGPPRQGTGGVHLHHQNQGGADNWGPTGYEHVTDLGFSTAIRHGASVDLEGDFAAIGAPLDIGTALPGYVYIVSFDEKDCNANGICDVTDILETTSSDDNDNGIPDECEPCPWDCVPPPDGNGQVNVDDLFAVINAISTQDLACDVAPDNGDGTFGNGVINFDDIVAIINNFGLCP